jgi:hypothetical protein
VITLKLFEFECHAVYQNIGNRVPHETNLPMNLTFDPVPGRRQIYEFRFYLISSKLLESGGCKVC